MTAKLLNPEKMSIEQLQEMFALDVEMQQASQQDVLARIQESKTMITGKGGRGKTLSAVAIAYMLRERFGQPVIAIGSKMGLGRGAGGSDAFGPFQNMDERDFKEELERLNVAASEEENAEQVAKAFEKYGVSILYSTLVFDEARKLLNSRRPQDKLVQLTGDFVMQARHYHCTTIILAPSEDEIDKRVVRQLDWKGRCYHNPYTDICRVRLTQGLEVLTLDIDGADNTLHPAYYDMYNSWTLLGYRQSSLSINRM